MDLSYNEIFFLNVVIGEYNEFYPDGSGGFDVDVDLLLKKLQKAEKECLLKKYQ